MVAVDAMQKVWGWVACCVVLVMLARWLQSVRRQKQAQPHAE